ncbi:MAG TPA: hypothetical protein VFJ94_08185 [Intrasporangium sp.]|uniref:hypothetical protein n=1 Tax=Intrasporangium sp. TaxID=1925024 RepID=UPI002D78B712|nr:hypothetical protein [Intrasporangium sp.]HET7398488.1 hypothetical protein [Intrasporangium sp.]
MTAAIAAIAIVAGVLAVGGGFWLLVGRDSPPTHLRSYATSAGLIAAALGGWLLSQRSR